MNPPVSHLLYLHGFRSSPGSAKAQRVAQAVRDLHDAGRAILWCCPQLPPSPSEALALIAHLTAGWPADERMGVIGSSLGGWYATVVAEARHCRAVLLNPAVDPARDLADQIGEQVAWHDPQLKFSFTAAHVDELRVLTPPAITHPERYAAVIAKGDEVLDWQEMTGRYPGARIRLLEGGDHAISDFEDHLPFVLSHLGLG
ncbi:YqiA/YcfP family alpha/beta fold hydrolase [Caldimonas sp. KR1-144]|uniref:YqiA/YcfP family alpha/beta fold hydrolase n=1 Tax=Caldimonas sp. KR1-144 TaxID=3400911 RepID=UPI003C05FA35